MLPAIDEQGKILMQSSHSMKLAPNGNGGAYASVVQVEAVRKHIESCEYVQIIGVDNILNKILDPVQIGFTACNQYTMTAKTCPKAYPEEKVGVIALKNDKYAIVEYSEMEK